MSRRRLRLSDCPVPRRLAQLAARGRALPVPALLLARDGPAALDHQCGDLPHVGQVGLHGRRHRGQLGYKSTRLPYISVHHERIR